MILTLRVMRCFKAGQFFDVTPWGYFGAGTGSKLVKSPQAAEANKATDSPVSLLSVVGGWSEFAKLARVRGRRRKRKEPETDSDLIGGSGEAVMG